MATRKPLTRGKDSVVIFYHPVKRRTVRVRLGDFNVVEENLAALNKIFLHPEYWEACPPGTPQTIRAQWGYVLSELEAHEATTSNMVERIEQAARARERELLRLLDEQARELSFFKRTRFGCNHTTLGDARDRVCLTVTGDATAQRDFRTTVARLVEKFGENTRLGTLVDRLEDLRAWVDTMRRTRNPRRGEPIDVVTKRLTMKRILKFLRKAGLIIEPGAVKLWEVPEKAIEWTREEDIARVEAALPEYWAKVWRLQCETGLRGTEIPTIKRSDLFDGMLTLTAGTGDLTLKRKTRTIPLSRRAREILEEATKDREVAFPKPGRKPWTQATWNASYGYQLRKVARKLGLRITGRHGRRSAASIWLHGDENGQNRMNISDVAAMLGDTERMVRGHYARVLPSEVKLPSKFA